MFIIGGVTMGFVTTDMMRKLLHLPDVEYDRESIGRRKRQEPLPATLQKLREYQWQARNKYSPSELFVLQGKAAENYSDETVYKDPCLHYYPCYSALSDASCGATLAGVREFAEGRWNHQTSLFTPFMPMN